MILHRKIRLFFVMGVCIFLLLTSMGAVQLGVLADTSAADTLPEPMADFSPLLERMFRDAYELGDYSQLPPVQGGAIMVMSDEVPGDTTSFTAYLEAFAAENGYHYQAQPSPLGEPPFGLRVNVTVDSLGENTYDVRLWIIVTPSCATSESAIVTVNPSTGALAYTVTACGIS